MGAQEIPLQPDFRERAKANDVSVGRLRGSSIKRVASAVGEGSIAISFIHQALQE